MRKKTFAYILDSAFWYVLYMLPIVAFLINLIHFPLEDVTSFVLSSDLSLIASSPIFIAIDGLFGSTGVFPLFTGDLVFIEYFGAYFVSVFLLHLAIDFVLFVPRLVDKFMTKFYREDE